MERHVLLIVPSVEGEALTLYHGQLRAAAHLIHRDVLAVILVVLHRAVHHGIDLRHGDAQLVPLITGGHRQPAGQLGHGIPGNIRQQHLRCVAPAVGDLLSRQPAEIRLHRVGGLLVAVRQHVHGTLGIRAVTVEIVRAQIAQGHGLPVWQLRRTIHNTVILRLCTDHAVLAQYGPRGDLREVRQGVAGIVRDGAVLQTRLQGIHQRLQARGAPPHGVVVRRHIVPGVHRAGHRGLPFRTDVLPPQPFRVVDECQRQIAPPGHLPVPLRGALRQRACKGVAHHNAVGLAGRFDLKGVGIRLTIAGSAGRPEAQRVQYRAHGGIVTDILRPQGVQLLRVQGIAALVLRRLRQQAHADDGRRDDQQDDSPEGGLLIVEHVLHPFFHSHFAKGQRAHRRHFRLGGAGHQCAGVCGPLGGRGVFQHHFITGALHVAAQQDIRRPEDRVEPVDRQQQKRQRFPHMVPAADMAPFVGEHLGKVLLRHGFRHINAGREHAQHEGRGPVGAAIDIVLYAGGGAEPPAHTQQAEGHVQRHAAHARQPDGGQLIQQRKALCRSGSCHFRALLRRGGNIGLFLLEKLLIGLDGRAFGLLETDGALYCQSGWKQQPQGHQQPQHTHGAAGRTAQQRPHRHHRQRDEARLPGNFQHGGKQTIHFFFSFMAQGMTSYAAARFSYVRNSPARSGRSWRGAHRHPLWKVLNFP